MPREIGQQDFEQRFLECNEKFNTIFRLTSTASKIISSDLTILKVNDALASMLGYTAEEIEGTQIMDHACAEYKAHWHELQEALWAGKVPFFKLQACLHRKDRTLVWVNVTTVLFEDMGQTYGFTVLDDITGLKHFEESEKRLNIALRYSKMAVCEFDLNENAVYRSEGHDEIFGYENQQESWTIERYYPHIWEDDLPKFKMAVDSLSEGGFMDQQVRLVTQDGSVKWVHFQGKTEAGKDGKPIKLLGTIIDITSEKLVERHKDDFISIASHELKTPITSLKISLQLLDRMKEELSGTLRGLVLQANRSINKIVLLVDDLLNASKTYKDQLDLKKTPFNLYKVIEECINQLRIERLHEIIINGPRALEINADAERIERVIVNLLSNAIKYAPSSKKITIQIEQMNAIAKVSVIDQGNGIAPEKLPLLFDRYYQGSSEREHYSGLGLGLFISAEIIKKHGGEIGVVSEEGKGSTFWFTVPV
ncbi:sensor histidine kinase [Mucilaginibacter pocheonensis]|uniref:histidine kinase n=1 Tax=Mucilaginibacter pocheonensis TaxID=398050 RepID=A0ABU1TF78_9SPHI|nr:PAS domain-containing sensor histidine kinase [Mucilaginibacter pocheonensis]MDR6944058.1 two-component system CheB/CheR fusion protein [Mucilaginibacter pocheonensis]